MYLPSNWTLEFNESVVDFFDENTDYNFSDYDLELRKSLRAAAYEPNADSFRDLIAMLVVSTSILGWFCLKKNYIRMEIQLKILLFKL